MNIAKILGILCVTLCSISSWCANAPTVTIHVDATSAPRKILHASL